MANYNVSYKIDATGNLVQVNQTAASINKNMKEAAVSAGALGKAASGALAATARRPAMEEREYERARGVTGMTGASGRDFAKQAEGLGGLVRVYATFAANIFAVTQAFEILKRSFSFEQLQKASDTFAVTTGKNLSGIAKELRILSDGALTAKAAQQFANYGQSAGFTADQLRRLVGVARGASQALGRDFSDAIDRLIRGTGKLEPELLDEIGILTRTKTAGEAYAKTLGKTFEQLTQFEKVQAFTNAVIEEGERKFGAVSKAVPVSAFEKFAAAAIDAGTALANFVNKGLVPLLDVLSNNPGLIVAGLVATIVKLATTALPFINNLAAKSRQAAQEQAKYASDKEQEALQAYKKVAAAKQAEIMRGANAAKQAADIFVEQENRKVQAIAKTAQAMVAERGKSANKTIKALAGVGSVDDVVAMQKTVDSRIKGAQSHIDRLSSGLTGLTGKQLAAQQASLKTHQETLTLLQKEKVTIDSIVANQQKYVALKQIQVTEEAKAAAVMEKMSVTSQKSAAMDAYRAKRADAIYQAVNVAQQKGSSGLGVGSAFKVLNMEAVALGKTVTEAGGKMDWLSKKMPAITGGLQAMATGSILASGGLRILGTAAIGLATGLASALGIISLIYFALDGLISLFGGYSDKIEAAKASQDTLNKTLDIASKQVGEFNRLQLENTGTLQGWARVAEYSGSALSTISDNLKVASNDLMEFQISTGAVSKSWQDLLSLFGKDVFSKQTKNIKDSIISSLALTTGDDKKKVQDAILSLFPSASTVEEALQQFDRLSDIQKTIKGQDLSGALAKVDTALKSNAANLKSASDAWVKLGEGIDEYNKKGEVKDPKLKDIVSSLKTIENAYRTASTEAERAKILSGVNNEQVEKLVALGKERNIDMSAWVKLIDSAKEKNRELLQEQKAAAVEQQELLRKIGQDFLSSERSSPYGAGPAAIAEAEATYNAIQNKIKETQNLDREGAANLTRELGAAYDKLYKLRLERSAEGNVAEKAAVDLLLADQKKSYESLGSAIFTILRNSISGGVQAGTQEAKVSVAQAVTDLRKMEVQSTAKTQEDDRAKKRIEDAAKATQALANSNAKVAKDKAVMSKAYELDVKLAQAQLEIIKQIAAIQQQAVGYVSSRVAGEQLAAQLKVIELQRVKEIAEIERDDAKRRKDKAEYNRSQRELDEASRTLANDAAARAKEAATLENLRLTLTREKVRYEKEHVDFVRMGLDLENQALDAAIAINQVNSSDVAALQADINARKELLALEQKSFEVAQREALLKAGRGRDGETAATIAAERDLIAFAKQRVELTKQLTVEQAAYNEYVNNVKADLEAINENLSQQLNFTIDLSSEAGRQQQALDQIRLLATDIVIEFEKLPRAQQNSIQLENMLLDAANKVLETKRQIYDLNSRSGSNADFTDTVKQGLELAALDFAKTSKSLARTTVDAMTGAIDAVVDDLFGKIKSGAKVTIGDLLKVGTDFVKNALLDFVSQEIKGFLRNSLAGLFGGLSPEEQQKQAITDLKRAITDSTLAVKQQKAPMDALVTALQDNTRALYDRAAVPGTGGAGSPASLDGFITNLFSPVSPAIDKATESLTNLDDVFGDIFKPAVGVAAGLTGAAGASINLESAATGAATALQSIVGMAGGGGGAGGIVGLLGSVGNMFKGIFGTGGAKPLPDVPDWDQPIAGPGIGDMFGQVMAGAGTGAAVGGLAASLFGNERNSKGIQMGGTVGGIAGTLLTPILGPLGPLIGSALGSALGSLWKSGGGPKSGGFAQTGTGFKDRFYTPSDKDSELTSHLKGVESSYEAIIGKLGGKGSAQFGLGFDTDPKGTANSRVTSGVIVGGKEITQTVEAGRSAEELTAAIERASKQLVLTAIKNSDLPENVAAYYAGISDEAIKEMDSEEIERKLDFGTILGAIGKSRDRIADLFGEDLYNLTEAQLEPFNKQGEKLSETFARLSNEFEATNRVAKYLKVNVKTAFGAVGLASAEFREELIEGAGGLQLFTDQFSYFLEHFFSETELAATEFANAGETIRDGFVGLGIVIPQTMAGYRQAVTDALAAGNIELYNSLMELAPAFDTVVGAIERVNASIGELAGDFLAQIHADTTSAQQRFEEFRAAANSDQAAIDEIMQMTPEALIQAVQAGTITPAQIEALASSAIENAQSAWNLLDENQKKILGPEFTRFTNNLTTNVSAVLEAINAAIMAGPKPDPGKVPEGTTSETVTPPTTEELLAIPEATGTAIVNAMTTGAEIVGASITNAFTSLSLTDPESGLGTGPLGTTPEQIEAQRYREEAAALAQTQMQEQQRVTQENHAAALAAMADKVLGAANGMLEAAAHMQAAASTPQQVNVTVQTLDDNVAAEVGV